MWTKPLFVDNALYIIDHPKSSKIDELMKDGDGLDIAEKIRIKEPLLKEQQEIIQKESKNGTITRAKAINSLFKELRTTQRTSGEHNASFMASQREDRGNVGLDENTFRGETNKRAGYKRNDDNSETVPDGGVTDDIHFQARKHYFGGNSGYVGYSKSKRAVEAEKNGLRNSSQMNKDKY